MSKSPLGTSVPASHLKWAHDMVPGKEHVLLPNFVRKFRFNDKNIANLAFSNLIGSSNLRKSRRARLQTFFENFQQNLEKSFWADRALQVSTMITSKQTATAVQKSGTKQAIHEYQRFTPQLDEDTIPEIYEDISDIDSDRVSEEEDENDHIMGSDSSRAVQNHLYDSIDDKKVEQSTPRKKFSRLAPIPIEPLDNPPAAGSTVQQRNSYAVYEGDDDDEDDTTAQAPSPAVVEVESGAETESDDEDDAEAFNDEEISGLLANIANAQHPDCTWKSGDSCIACLFQKYQRDCIQALQDNNLRKIDIADVMAIIGVFAPFLPTDRMRETFEPKVLKEVANPSDLPGLEIDDAAVLKAVRLRINNKREEASEAIGKVDRTLRLMFDNLLESLPDEVNRSISEVTFTVNYVAPVLNSILRTNEIDVQYPNTESSVQKVQGLKPDRPDILVKAFGYEILYGEITGPCRATCKGKTNWDLFRLARFGKAYLDTRDDSVPLLQVVHDSGLAMKLKFKVRGVYLLEKVGRFTIPCTTATIPALLATLPVLLSTKTEVEMMSDSNFNKNRKRSWRFNDIANVKKRIK